MADDINISSGDVSITVSGFQDLQTKNKALVQEIAESGNLVAKAAYVIEGQAKINATGRPGPKVQTGRLKSSITTAIDSPMQARVGPNVSYAPFVEFGHSQHVGQYVPPLKRRLVKPFAPAYPFMGPTIDQCKDQMEGVFVSYGNDLEAIWGSA